MELLFIFLTYIAVVARKDDARIMAHDARTGVSGDWKGGFTVGGRVNRDESGESDRAYTERRGERVSYCAVLGAGPVFAGEFDV